MHSLINFTDCEIIAPLIMAPRVYDLGLSTSVIHENELAKFN